MARTIIENTLEGEAPPDAPLREDGTNYNYCMYVDDYSSIVFADTPEELLETYIPGYSEMDEAERVYERIRFAQAASAAVQAQILFEEGVGEKDVTGEEWAVLTAPRNLAQPRADWWTCEVPLVVVETAYEPYTTVPRPASALADGKGAAPNLLWVRPGEEEDFLVSLHEIGYLFLMQSDAA